MSKEKVRKTIELTPLKVTDLTGNEVSLEYVLSKLSRDVRTLTRLTENHISSKNLERVKALDNGGSASTLGARAGIAMIPEDEDRKFPRKIGASRRRQMIQAGAVEVLRSWAARQNGASGVSTKHMSKGYKRTANSNKPKGLKPKMNLGYANSQYRVLSVEEKHIVLKLVVSEKWYTFYFPYTKRFDNAEKISSPTISLDENNVPRWWFPAEWEYNYVHFSSEYVIGVDVGVTNYATVSVIEVSSGKTVFITTLSQRVHSLCNKIRSTSVQIANLHKKGKHDEATPHREANTRRKHELAILAGKEIAHISFKYNNALVAVEDLTHIRNTMLYGRWNRGELVKRIVESVHHNGGRVMKVNAAYTSQLCHKCGEKLDFPTYHDVLCTCGYFGDRDVNAAINIAKNLVKDRRFEKCCKTRNTEKNKNNKLDNKSRGGEGKNLKYPGTFNRKKKVDRTKNAPTPKRLKQTKTDYSKEVKEINLTKGFSPAQKFTVALDANVCESSQTRMTITGGTTISSDSRESKAYIDYRLL